MMSASTHADLTELLGYLSIELAEPQGDLRATLLHATSELARILRDDLYEQDEDPTRAGSGPRTPAPAPCEHDRNTVAESAEVLAVRENGALLKIRNTRGIHHLKRSPGGWQFL